MVYSHEQLLSDIRISLPFITDYNFNITYVGQNKQTECKTIGTQEGLLCTIFYCCSKPSLLILMYWTINELMILNMRYWSTVFSEWRWRCFVCSLPCCSAVVLELWSPMTEYLKVRLLFSSYAAFFGCPFLLRYVLFCKEREKGKDKGRTREYKYLTMYFLNYGHA